MNEDQRQALADMLGTTLRTRFGGSKKAAYTAIGINPATFDRALAALPIRDDRATRIINELWPAAKGDIRNVRVEAVGSDEVVHISVPRRPLSAQEQRRRASINWLGQQPETYRERMVDWMQDLEERLDALERAALGRLSEVPDRTDASVPLAADEDSEPIERGQGHDEDA